MDKYDRDEIIRLTEEYGGAWGIHHTQRLLHLMVEIGEGLTYDAEIVWLAAHLHDWGASARWAQPNVDHCLRSCEVANTFLTERGFQDEVTARVLECIELHHTAGSDRCLESVLLRDADALDFLGVVGVLRNFSMNPREMRKAYDETRRRQDKMMGVIFLEKAKAIAADRDRAMRDLLRQFETETSGCF